MPTDLALVNANLASFYDFGGKVVVHVGAGGGRLLGYAPLSKKVFAVDNDVSAIEQLEASVSELALNDVVSVVAGDFYDLDLSGDVVLFEFCLHDMRAPRVAIDHARAIAAEIVVIEHLPESEWSWYANEDAAMVRAWEAVETTGAGKKASYRAVQRFDDYRELEAQLRAQGTESLKRIGALLDRTDIVIPMPYGIALIESNRGVAVSSP